MLNILSQIPGYVWLTIAVAVILIIATAKSVARNKAAAAALAESAPQEEKPQPTAPGAAGGLKLYDTPPKTAAMLMAIVADKVGKPVNELRFISIKEVK